MIPATTNDPFTRSRRAGAIRNALLHFVQGLDASQIDLQFGLTAIGEMTMSVVKAGHDKLPAQVDDLSSWSLMRKNLVSADSHDLVSSNRDCACTRTIGCRKRIIRRREMPASVDVAVSKDHIGSLRERRGREKQQPENSFHYGLVNLMSG